MPLKAAVEPDASCTAPGWIRRGFPRTVGWLFVVVAPLTASGMVRAVTGWPLGISLAVALAATVPTVAASGRARAPSARTRRQSLVLGVAMLAVAAVATTSLYIRAFGGMVVLASSGIPDAGNHVLQQHEFVKTMPGVYMGFVGLYSFVEWLKRLGGCDDFTAFVIGTYVPMAAYSCLGLAVAGTVLERHAARGRVFVAGVAAAAAWSLVVLVVLLPFLHYHHAEGFFPPIFAILPLAGLWLADGLLRRTWLRAGAYLVAIALYRYTYGLNLPELLLAVAVVLLLEARSTSRRVGRFALIVLAVVLAGGAVHAARLLETVFRKPGPFDSYELRPVLVAEWISAGALAAACVVRPTARLLVGSGVMRWVRLPVVFALVNALFMTFVAQPARGADYYYLKSNFHPILLLLAASVVVVAALVAGVAAARADGRVGVRDWTAVGSIGGTLLVAAILLARGFSPYWSSFHERLVGRPPFKLLKPVADRQGWRRISRVLREHHADFGGYLTSYYPTFNFMNASFDYWNGGIDFYWGASPAERPGYCVFWEGGSPESRLERVFPQQATCDRLSRDSRRTCVGYHPSWSPQSIRTLCWLCP